MRNFAGFATIMMISHLVILSFIRIFLKKKNLQVDDEGIVPLLNEEPIKIASLCLQGGRE